MIENTQRVRAHVDDGARRALYDETFGFSGVGSLGAGVFLYEKIVTEWSYFVNSKLLRIRRTRNNGLPKKPFGRKVAK